MPTLDLTLPATTNGLETALMRIDDFAASGNVHADALARLRVIVEELVSNTIKYGYGGECDRPFRLTLETIRGLRLTYEDDAPPFDPTAWRRSGDPDLAPDERPPGQAGINLVLGLVETAAYARTETANRLILTLREPLK